MVKDPHEADQAEAKADAVAAIAGEDQSGKAKAEQRRELADQLKTEKANEDENVAATENLEGSADPAPRKAGKGKDWMDAQYGANAPWFRERRTEDLERELAGARARGDKAYEKNVLAELEAMGHGQRAAAKRPRTAPDKETR